MKIKPTTRISAMLRVYPQLEDVFEAHDVEVDDDVMSMSIRRLCSEYGLDADDILGDLRAALRDSADDGWMVGEDELDEEEEEDEDEEEDDDYQEEDDYDDFDAEDDLDEMEEEDEEEEEWE